MNPIHPHLSRPGRGGGWPATLLILLPLLSACSGTPFGEALSRSFPAPAAEGGAGAATTPAPGDSPPAGTTLPDAAKTSRPPGAAGSGPGSTSPAGGTQPSRAGGAVSGSPASAGASSSGATASAAAPKPGAATPVSPAARVSPGGVPYRVTIRLPLADPSAPAEVVTEALRSAGVAFEVETIERLSGAASGGSGAALAPPPAQVRPAPPPR